MTPRCSALALLGLTLLSCKRPAPNAAAKAGAATSANPSPANVDRTLLDLGAFDFVNSQNGAVLVWASKTSGALELAELDESGWQLRVEALLPLPDARAPTLATIGEVAATVRGTDLAVAWLERSSTSTRARGFVRPLQGGSAGHVVEIGNVLEPVSAPRGNLALTNHDGHFVVLARGQQSECTDASAHDCVGFGFHRLEADRATAQGLPLTVPLPCAQNAVSFAVTSSRWYYGVCSQSTGKPVTTLFSIQPDPEYARADQLLEGCSPLGALAEHDELWLVGDCGGARRALRVRGGNAETLEMRVDRSEAGCESGYPVIRQAGPAGMRLVLGVARDRLEAFLPEALSTAGARAVWTGHTLLVASPQHGALTLKGYQCDSTLLREVALPTGITTAAH